MMYEFLRREKS